MRLMEICMKDNEKVTKRIFFTKLKFAKLEGKLAQMEQEGYRLAGVSGLYRFEFTKSKCKDTRYFCTYDEKGLRSTSFEISQELVHNYQAERVRNCLSVGIGLTKVYRTVQADCDLTKFSLARDRDLIKAYFNEIIFFLMFFVLAAVGVVSSAGTERMIFLIFAIMLALPVLWCLIAIIQLKKRTKNQNK